MSWFLYPSVDYAQAVAFKNKRRNIKPPVYNSKRLNEMPMPDTTPDDFEDENDDANSDDNNDISANEHSITEENLSDNVFAISLPDIEQEPNSVSNESELDFQVESHQLSSDVSTELIDPVTGHLSLINRDTSSFDGDTEDEQEQAQIFVPIDLVVENSQLSIGASQNAVHSLIEDLNVVENEDVKPNLVPLYETPAMNRTEIADLITEPQVEKINDELTIMINPHSDFPMPWKATDDAIVKRENDVLSGNIAFNIEVSVSLKTYF